MSSNNTPIFRCIFWSIGKNSYVMNQGILHGFISTLIDEPIYKSTNVLLFETGYHNCFGNFNMWNEVFIRTI